MKIITQNRRVLPHGGALKTMLILAALPIVTVAGEPLAPVSPPVPNASSEGLQPLGVLSAAATSCSWTFSSGSGHNATQYCVTGNGNITQFSRAGLEYINAGAVEEGYGICDFSSSAAYYDYADTDSGNWGPTSVVSVTATTVVLRRTTSDGIWRLTQTITKGAASGTSPGSAAVTMALKNNSGVARSVWLLRHADVDANGTPSDDHFDYTIDTAMGLQPSFGGGLSAINQTFSFSYDAYVQSVYSGPAPCSAFANYFVNSAAGFVGDGSIDQLWSISVPAFATKTVKMTYKPI
jgi:hypothetical protein